MLLIVLVLLSLLLTMRIWESSALADLCWTPVGLLRCSAPAVLICVALRLLVLLKESRKGLKRSFL